MLNKDKIMEMGKMLAGPAPSPIGAVKKALKYQKEQFKNRTEGTNILDKIKSKLKARELMNKEINSKVSLPNQSTPNDYKNVYEKQEGVKVKDKKEKLYQEILAKIAEDKRSKKSNNK